MSWLLLVAVFLAGAYVALLVRALIARAGDRRIQAAARDALSDQELELLKQYVGAIDRAAVDGG